MRGTGLGFQRGKVHGDNCSFTRALALRSKCVEKHFLEAMESQRWIGRNMNVVKTWNEIGSDW